MNMIAGRILSSLICVFKQISCPTASNVGHIRQAF